MRIRLLATTAALCSTLGLAGAASAARAATLLATAPSDRTSMLVRPGFMSFDQGAKGRTPDYLMGPGLTRRGYDHGREPPIVWSAWGTRATGRATYWLGQSATCHTCRYIRYVVKLAAWRVRQGHYTRFAITVPHGTVVYALTRIRIPVNGLPGGLPAYTWCYAKQPKPCTPP
jgi:hypothetical protein